MSDEPTGTNQWNISFWGPSQEEGHSAAIADSNRRLMSTVVEADFLTEENGALWAYRELGDDELEQVAYFAPGVAQVARRVIRVIA